MQYLQAANNLAGNQGLDILDHISESFLGDLILCPFMGDLILYSFQGIIFSEESNLTFFIGDHI